MKAEFWRDYFKTPQRTLKYDMTVLIPAAGRGKRFADAGYAMPKPMIPVNGKPMLLQSVKALPQAAKWIFLCLENHLNQGLKKEILSVFPKAAIIPVNGVTQGMLNTCLLAEKQLDIDKPLLISACDYDLRYDEEAFDRIVRNSAIDAAIWTFRNHDIVRNNPEDYAYTAVDEDGNITYISEKKTISPYPEGDHAVVSVFYFRTAGLFLDGARSLIKSGKTINNEYYVATSMNGLITAGRRVVPFEVDKFICWGTPRDLEEYENWKSKFDKQASSTQSP